MQEKQGGFAKAQANKMTIQGQPGSSGADGWSLRWVSHNIKTPSQRPLLVPRTGALGEKEGCCRRQTPCPTQVTYVHIVPIKSYQNQTFKIRIIYQSCFPVTVISPKLAPNELRPVHSAKPISQRNQINEEACLRSCPDYPPKGGSV